MGGVACYSIVAPTFRISQAGAAAGLSDSRLKNKSLTGRLVDDNIYRLSTYLIERLGDPIQKSGEASSSFF